MTTPLTDAIKLERRIFAALEHMPMSFASTIHFSDLEQYTRALLAQPSVAPPAPGGDAVTQAITALRLAAVCADTIDWDKSYAARFTAAADALQSTQAPCPYEPHTSGICTKCGKVHAPPAAQGQDAALADQPQALIPPNVSWGMGKHSVHNPFKDGDRAARAKE